MNNIIKFLVSKYYIFSGLILPIGLFLFVTFFLIFGRPTTKDLPPMIFFGVLYLLFTILSVKKILILARKEFTTLELNEREIIDSIFNISIRWDNISDMRFLNKGVNSCIAIDLKDKQAVISRTKNIFKRLRFYFNELATGTPITIQTIYIKGNNSDIFKQMYGQFKEIG